MERNLAYLPQASVEVVDPLGALEGSRVGASAHQQSIARQMCERARSVAVFRVNPIDDGGQLQQATEPKFVRSFWKVTLCVESLKGFPSLSLSLYLSALLSIDHDLGLKGADARRIESQSVVDSKEFGWNTCTSFILTEARRDICSPRVKRGCMRVRCTCCFQ